MNGMFASLLALFLGDDLGHHLHGRLAHVVVDEVLPGNVTAGGSSEDEAAVRLLQMGQGTLSDHVVAESV